MLVVAALSCTPTVASADNAHPGHSMIWPRRCDLMAFLYKPRTFGGKFPGEPVISGAVSA
jgi:hypothetical protein